MRRKWITVLLAAGVAATTAGAMPAAAAQPRPRPPSPIVGHGMHRLGIHIPRTHAAQVVTDAGATATSTNWSGYVDVGAPGHRIKSISSSFTIPALNCAKSPDGAFAAHWVGLDGWADGTIEQAGIFASCSGGTASYLAFYDMNPEPSVAFAGVSPGHAVSASVAYNAPTWNLTLTDITTGAVIFTTTQACPSGSTCQNGSAEVITGGPGTVAATGNSLPDFGRANFLNAAVTGQSGVKGTLATKAGHWTSTRVTMVNGADTLAVPSALEGRQSLLRHVAGIPIDVVASTSCAPGGPAARAEVRPVTVNRGS